MVHLQLSPHIHTTTLDFATRFEFIFEAVWFGCMLNYMVLGIRYELNKLIWQRRFEAVDYCIFRSSSNGFVILWLYFSMSFGSSRSDWSRSEATYSFKDSSRGTALLVGPYDSKYTRNSECSHYNSTNKWKCHKWSLTPKFDILPAPGLFKQRPWGTCLRCLMVSLPRLALSDIWRDVY